MWVKLDDRFWSNRKVRKAGNSIGVYVLALTWSADELTDGRIPADELDFICHSFPDPHGDAETLELVGLFERQGDVWIIPDYLEYNESAATIREKRAKDRQRKAAGGIRKPSRRNPDGLRTESGSPVPVPVPVPNDVSTDVDTSHDDEPDPADIELCNHLADAIERSSGKRPAIAKSWHTPMRLLRQRGPAEWATPEPIDPDRIRTLIDWAHNDDFWPDKVRNPTKLRKHWESLRASRNRTIQPNNQPNNQPTNPNQGIGVDMAFVMMNEETAA